MDAVRAKEWDVAQGTFLGYPCNMAYNDHYKEIFPSLGYHFNNVGDPYEDSLYRVHTKDSEKRVLAFFEDLWGFDPANVWGYITANGTEGNLQALYIAKQLYPDAIAYTSHDTHYSIPKICRILGLPLRFINSRPNGEMDYDHLDKELAKSKGRPAIVNANLGTTMLGATDNTREIYRILCKHGLKDKYYMHADGALMGFVLPFIEKDLFFKKRIHSISISGHKFLGVPFPCGVFMMEKRLLDIVKKHIDIIGTSDCTISGSRNGHSALFLDHIIQKRGRAGFESDIMACIDTADYMVNMMNHRGLEAWRNQNSVTVVFEKPHDSVVRRWQLATSYAPERPALSHAVVLPHVTRRKVNTFVKDVVLANRKIAFF